MNRKPSDEPHVTLTGVVKLRNGWQNELEPKKICTLCKRELSLSAFGNRTASKDGLAQRCKECLRSIGRQRSTQDQRLAQIKCRYGLTQDDYGELLRKQNGRCAICGSPPPIPKQEGKGNKRHLCIDHNHVTGRVRGLLCDDCNIALSKVKETPQILMKMVDYLYDHRPDWDDYFLSIAKAVSIRADCLRAKHGCVITKDRRIISTGYNAAQAGGPSCLAGECPRGLLSYAELQSLAGDYDSCISIHSEANALLHASHADTRGATLYVTGKQCGTCRKLSMGAGIARVVWPDGEELFK